MFLIRRLRARQQSRDEGLQFREGIGDRLIVGLLAVMVFEQPDSQPPDLGAGIAPGMFDGADTDDNADMGAITPFFVLLVTAKAPDFARDDLALRRDGLGLFL